jgi:ketosteroid isomerase-like protein
LDVANGEGGEASADVYLDLRVVRASLLAADAASGALAAQGPIPALTQMLDDDVAFLDPGEQLLLGKGAALAMLAADGVSGSSTQTWAAVRADVSSDGREGFTYGYGSVTGPFCAGGATRTLPAKYIAYWRKDATTPGAPRPTCGPSSR